MYETGKKEYQEMFPNADNLLKEVPMIGKRRELWNKSADEITFRDTNENNFDLYLSWAPLQIWLLEAGMFDTKKVISTRENQN